MRSMKINNVNYKRLALILTSGFVLVGGIKYLGKNKELKQNLEIEITSTEMDNDSLLKSTEIDVIEKIPSTEETIEVEKVEAEEIEETESLTADEIITQYLNQMKTEMSQENGNFQEVKDKIITYFIDLVDFIYYGKEIKGITYDELSEATKENVMESFQLLDSIVDRCFPDYKERISSEYQEIKEKASAKAKEALGDDNWNKLENSKESLGESTSEVKDVVNDISEKGKTKVKNWYEDFKNKHE